MSFVVPTITSFHGLFNHFRSSENIPSQHRFVLRFNNTAHDNVAQALTITFQCLHRRHIVALSVVNNTLKAVVDTIGVAPTVTLSCRLRRLIVTFDIITPSSSFCLPCFK